MLLACLGMRFSYQTSGNTRRHQKQKMYDYMHDVHRSSIVDCVHEHVIII